MKVKYKVRCNHCSNYQEYNPRSIQKIPDRPDTRCNNCNRKIRINRADLINYINNLTSKSGGWGKKEKKYRGENQKKGKVWGKLEILKLLEQGFYAQEICRKLSLSPKRLSLFVKWLKEQDLIIQTKKFPKTYQLTEKGKLLVNYPLEKTKVGEKSSSEKIITSPGTDSGPDWIKKCRVHKLRFKNVLIQRPSWLNALTANETRINGFLIKKVRMQNWDKYVVKLNYNSNGIDNIEIGTNTIIYNFRKKLEDQFVYSGNNIKSYVESRIQECKDTRAFLEKKGFVIDNRDPELAQKPHFAFLAHGDPQQLGSLGQFINMSIKTPNAQIEIDDSPKNGGEEETTDEKKAQSVLDIPLSINKLQNEVSEIKNGQIQLTSVITELVNILKGYGNDKQNNNNLHNNSGGLFT